MNLATLTEISEKTSICKQLEGIMVHLAQIVVYNVNFLLLISHDKACKLTFCLVHVASSYNSFFYYFPVLVLEH